MSRGSAHRSHVPERELEPGGRVRGPERGSVATRVLLEHVRHVCPPALEIELLVLAPEEIVALADVEGEEGGVVLELNGARSNPRLWVELSRVGALHDELLRRASVNLREPRPTPVEVSPVLET